MKTKEEILKMSKTELEKYKWSNDLNEQRFDCSHHCSDCYFCYDCYFCSDCYRCSDCYFCYDCYFCSDCYLCRDVKGLKYAICNVEMSKKEYENKMKELNN
jgi:hypothetical protein